MCPERGERALPPLGGLGSGRASSGREITPRGGDLSLVSPVCVEGRFPLPLVTPTLWRGEISVPWEERDHPAGGGRSLPCLADCVEGRDHRAGGCAWRGPCAGRLSLVKRLDRLCRSAVSAHVSGSCPGILVSSVPLRPGRVADESG